MFSSCQKDIFYLSSIRIKIFPNQSLQFHVMYVLFSRMKQLSLWWGSHLFLMGLYLICMFLDHICFISYLCSSFCCFDVISIKLALSLRSRISKRSQNFSTDCWLKLELQHTRGCTWPLQQTAKVELCVACTWVLHFKKQANWAGVRSRRNRHAQTR